MKSAQGNKVYTSPMRKLVRFFEMSRDRWKAKYRKAQATSKRLKNRVRFLEKSRAKWKSQGEDLTTKLGEMKTRQEAMEKELADLKQEKAQEPTNKIEMCEITPQGHQYTIGHVALFTDLVLNAGTSLQGTERAMQIMFSHLKLELASPSWSSGRLWLLRLGYYKLTRPKQKADDWIWIADHTVQVGSEKCLVLLGIRVCDLPPAGQCLSHKDVELIALLPIKKSNGKIVYQQLEEAIEETGAPCVMVGDHGSDLKSGVDQFCEMHQGTVFVYDIKHKTAAVRKQELHKNEDWLTFACLASQTKNQIQQTELAALAPPNQRTKARYMNVDTLISWGQKTLAFLDRQQVEASPHFDPEQVQAKVGWLNDFRQQIEDWSELLQGITTAESFVRQQGLHRQSHLELKDLRHPLAHSEQAKKVCSELLTFVAEQR